MGRPQENSTIDFSNKIAITGSGIRLPGNNSNLEQLWSFLIDGGDAIRDLPDGRWPRDLYDPAGGPGRTYVRRGGYIDGIDQIDTSFFNVSPKEAMMIDPQQRLLVETAYEALENAGLSLDSLRQTRTGVFVGLSSGDYGQLLYQNPRSANAYTNTGSAASIAANRISYLFDLRGPSLAIDTACSSGLTALDAAVRSIQAGACDQAIVAGANVLLKAEPFVGFCAAKMLSPVGQCRAFDADGAGFVRAEGAVAFVLKPMDRALAERDPLLGVILGSDTNNDGRTGGLSLPNKDAQLALIERVLSQSGVQPEDIGYVEAHGTGTAVGDPIEAEAIGRGIATKREDGSTLPIGSIKTNLGHLEPASGLAGLAKALLCLKHRSIPPSIHFDSPNPNIDFSSLRLEVASKMQPLSKNVVGVNSFGFGGANAHVLVARPPERVHEARPKSAPSWYMVSARSSEALAASASALANHIEKTPDISLYDLAGTLQERRTAHPLRAAVWAENSEDLQSRLRSISNGETAPGTATGSALPLQKPVFVFTGNGSQWWGMGRELLESSASFRATIDEIDAIFRASSDIRLIDEMTAGEGDSRMELTEIAQPALFALQLGIVRLLEQEGLLPAAVVGHSAGELAAAAVAGTFDLETISKIVLARSRQQARTAGQGGMAALGMGADDAREYLANWPEIVVAGDNSPVATSIAGPHDKIDALLEQLKKDGKFARKLDINYPFHSPAMDPIETGFREDIAGLCGQTGRIPFYSTVTGGVVEGSKLDADYWWNNLRQPVLFRTAIETLQNDGHGIFVEVGPHPNLLRHIQSEGERSGHSVRTVETLRKGDQDTDRIRKTVIASAVAGADLDHSGRFEEPIDPIELPNYPWQKERHYIDVTNSSSIGGVASSHPFLGFRLPTGDGDWVQEFSLGTAPFVGDHVVRERVLFPATGFLETALAAGLGGDADTGIEINDLKILKALAIRKDEQLLLQTSYNPTDTSLTISSRRVDDQQDEQTFEDYVTATVRRLPVTIADVDVAEIRARLTGSLSAEEHYQLTTSRGLQYGETFQVVDRLETGKGEVLATLSRRSPDTKAYHLDPTIVDGALQAMIGLIGSADNRLFLPVEITNARIPRSVQMPDTVLAHVEVKEQSRFHLMADVTLCTENGEAIAALHGVQLRLAQRIDGGAVRAWHHEFEPHAGFDDALPNTSTLELLQDYRPSDLNAKRRSISGDYNKLAEKVCALFSAEAFRDLAGDEPFAIDELVEQGKLAAKHTQYAAALLELCARYGTADRLSEERWRILAGQPALETWRESYRQYPQYATDCLSIARIGGALPGILRGETEGLEVLFPDNSATMEQLYDQGFNSLEANQMLAHAVRSLAEKVSDTRPIRVLEVGGGTGGTTGHVLKALSGLPVDYLFTDVSSAFLGHAESRFEDQESFKTAVFNLEDANHELFEERFDVVIGANVVHATKNVRASLRSLKRLLRSNGVLILSEIEKLGYFDFIFGSLPDVWRFEDHDDRKNHALLGREEWKSILQSEAFEDVRVVGDLGDDEMSNFSIVMGVHVDEPSPGISVMVYSEKPTKRSLVIDNGSLVAAETVATLRNSGAEIREVKLADLFESTESLEDAEAFWTRVFENPEELPDEIVFFAPTAENSAVSDVLWPLITMMKVAGSVTGKKRLIIVTEGLDIPTDEQSTAASHWAVGRVIVNEYMSWSCVRVDCDPDEAARARLTNMLAESRLDGFEPNEDEIRVKADGIQVNRLSLVPEESQDEARAGEESFTYTLTAQGSLENLKAYRTRRDDEIPEGCVEIGVRSAGINFKDVMLTLGVLPPNLFKESEIGPRVGLEGAGVVERVGDNVESLSVGDRVFFMAEGCFASHITIPATAVQRFPEEWSFDEAATLPVVGLTTVYALLVVAQLREGETLLVHGGAGGVGMAAIQIAQSIGAKVIATAGTTEKRELLQALGVDHVSDSRSLAFVEDVRRATGGKGVDVVLNSLAGQPMLASLDLVKPFGRFIEIGKRDFEENSRLNLRSLEMNVSYHAVDLTYLWEARPDLFAMSWQKLIEMAHSGSLRPLPFRRYPASDLADGMRLMQSGRHIGKLVADFSDTEIKLNNIEASKTAQLSGDGAHVLAGGLGGVGLKVAKWLALRGARNIVLTGRKGVTDDSQREAIREIEAVGAKVVVHTCDITAADQVNKLVDDIKSEFGSIRGVFNSALVLDDGLISVMTLESLRNVVRPKADGARYLHTATLGEPLEYFVAFSSLANVIGNPGQSNYVAANAFMEQLITERRNQGLPGLVLQLGAIEDVGILERDKQLRSQVNPAIGETILSDDVLAALDQHLMDGPAIVALTRANAKLKVPIASTGRMFRVISNTASTDLDEIDLIDFAKIPAEERQEKMEGFLLKAAASITGANSDRIDVQRSLGDLGLDSLMAVEFSHILDERLGVSVSPADIAQDRNLRELATILLRRLQLPDTPQQPADGNAAAPADPVDEKEEQAASPPELETAAAGPARQPS